jgi:hypothetical protein
MAISTHHGEMCQKHIVLTDHMSRGSTCVNYIIYSHLMGGTIHLQGVSRPYEVLAGSYHLFTCLESCPTVGNKRSF